MEEATKSRSEDKRMGHRWKMDSSLKYSLLDSNEIREAKISDFSLRGMKINTLSPLSIGEEIKLFINTSDEEGDVNAWGKVVWNSRIEDYISCGISFTKVRDIDKERIIAFIDKKFGKELRTKIWWQDSN